MTPLERLCLPFSVADPWSPEKLLAAAENCERGASQWSRGVLENVTREAAKVFRQLAEHSRA